MADVDHGRPPIRPRSDWAGDRPTGPTRPEDDVRFLLVHHTASTNSYEPADVVPQLQSFYELHTSAEKGWPDIAYNFLIDRFGTIWEGRAGSIDGPVRGDATGGSQGFAQLVSLIGDHAAAPPTDEAVDALISMLAWLGSRHDIDTTPGSTVSFVSRGSNRWPAGSSVTTTTIAGHRDMSLTACPGDFLYNRLSIEIAGAVEARRIELNPADTIEADPAGSTTSSTGEDSEPEAPTTASTTGATTTSTTAPTTAVSPSTESAAQPTDVVAVGGSSGATDAALAGAGAAATVVGGLLWLRTRRTRPR